MNSCTRQLDRRQKTRGMKCSSVDWNSTYTIHSYALRLPLKIPDGPKEWKSRNRTLNYSCTRKLDRTKRTRLMKWSCLELDSTSKTSSFAPRPQLEAPGGPKEWKSRKKTLKSCTRKLDRKKKAGGVSWSSLEWNSTSKHHLTPLDLT